MLLNRLSLEKDRRLQINRSRERSILRIYTNFFRILVENYGAKSSSPVSYVFFCGLHSPLVTDRLTFQSLSILIENRHWRFFVFSVSSEEFRTYKFSPERCLGVDIVARMDKSRDATEDLVDRNPSFVRPTWYLIEITLKHGRATRERTGIRILE